MMIGDGMCGKLTPFEPEYDNAYEGKTDSILSFNYSKSQLMKDLTQ